MHNQINDIDINEELPPSDYLPDNGEPYNESGLADLHIGHLFGITARTEGWSSTRPAFLQKEA